MPRKFKLAERSNRSYSSIIPFDSNKPIIITKFHNHEGITQNMIIETLKKCNKKHRNVHFRNGFINSFFITQLIKKFPPIRLTVVFRETKEEIIVTNAFLGGINTKTTFERNGIEG